MVASSNVVAVASLQNSREYSRKGRSRWARATKRAATSITAGAREKKQEQQKTVQKRENKNEGGETPLTPGFGSVILSHSRRGEQGARRHGD